jgi:spermidine synthase
MSPQRRGESKVLFSRWSPVFRVDVVEGSDPARHMLNHDGMIGSSILAFGGDFSALKAQFDTDPRSHPFKVLDPSPKVLIIGAAGGHEILASLYFGAAEITAVELNPVTVSLLKEHFAEYTGNIAEDSRVKLVNAEGRSFLKRNDERYDLIWFVAPDSYAAMNAATSGAFVLSESYLYTHEMIIEALAHLRGEGMICVQFGEIAFDRKPNRTARYLATAREAFRRLGVDDFGRHVVLSTTPEFFTMATILLKNTPFSVEEVRRFRASAETVRPVGKPSTVWHAAGVGDGDGSGHAVNQVISLAPEALERWFDEYAYDVRPVTDDSPFFWHFARFGDALLRPWGVEEPILDPEDATGERVLITLLAFVVVFAALLLLLPLAAVRGVWRRIPHKANAGIYFAALGLGFMFFEVCLIQKLTLFLGYPTYSLTVTLFALLIFTAVGSLLSSRYSARRGRALLGLLSALLLLVLLYRLGMPLVVDAFVGSVFPVRIALAVLLLAPLGFCLGAFMPIGLASMAAVTEFKQEYVAWCWAVNGFFSVMSSILAIMLSMTIGFDGLLLLAVIVYAVGVVALLRVPDRRASLT